MKPTGPDRSGPGTWNAKQESIMATNPPPQDHVKVFEFQAGDRENGPHQGGVQLLRIRGIGHGPAHVLAVRQHGSDGHASTPINEGGLRALQHALSLELADQAETAAEAIHPAPVEFTVGEVADFPVLRYFHYSHLPPALQERSAPFARLARTALDTSPRADNAELAEGLRKLLEAKDCIVRAALPKK